jgi:hypothetical protein
MRKALVMIAACALIAGAARPAEAWGYAGHRLIMRRAIELLPPELKPFFEHYRDEIVVRVVDPDQWRNVGWPDDPNHFVDYGVPEYGPYPFTALPHEYGAALQKFGPTVLERNGRLPWRAAEMFGYLQRTFAELSRNAPYTISTLVLLTPITAHYMQDAYQPFHATDNYDGRATGNDGIHARFERDLIERFESRLRLSPATPVAITNPRDYAFDTLLPSYQAVDVILKADKEALGSKDAYDDEYFEAFFARVQPILERQLSGAIAATAGVIIGAWQEAGRPVLRLQDTRPVERVRPPRR